MKNANKILKQFEAYIGSPVEFVQHLSQTDGIFWVRDSQNNWWWARATKTGQMKKNSIRKDICN